MDGGVTGEETPDVASIAWNSREFRAGAGLGLQATKEKCVS